MQSAGTGPRLRASALGAIRPTESMSGNTVILNSPSAEDVSRPQPRRGIWSMLREAAVASGSLPGFIALCDQGLVSVTNFATAVIIGRVCGKAELGVYTLAWTLITVVTGILATLIITPYIVFSPQMGRARRRQYLGSILGHQLLLSLIFALSMAAGAALGSRLGWLSDTMASVVRTSAAAVGFISLREFIRNVSFADLRIGRAFSVDLAACLVQAAGMLLLLHFGALTVSRTFTILGIASAMAAVGWLAVYREAFRFDRRLCVPDLKRNWAFGKWVLGSGLLWQCSGYLFPWVLAAFHGSSITGVWAACSAIVALGNPVLLGLCNYVLPRISNVYAAAGILKMKRYVHRCSLVLILLLLPVVAVMAVFGERILTAVYGKGYGGTAAVLVLLALNMLIITLAKPYSQGLFSLECAKADTFVNVVWVSLLIAVGVPAVKAYGAFGAAATMLACSSLAVGIKIIVFAREVRCRS